MLAIRLIKEGCEWKTNWDWTRNPTGRTRSELEGLLTSVNSFKYNSAQSNSWKWILHSSGRFHCSVLGSLINQNILQADPIAKETLRNNLVPQKLGIFVWRCRMGRLPVLTELDKRGVDLNSVRCPVCDNDIETVDHLLINCSFAKDIWSRVRRWWNISSPMCMNREALFLGKRSAN
ncbi:uncharacterized protein [Rutidosis leptorrhynchoides]|uniref:uncharacterized protein n=1 Tax=Rutidosis leptorrhynchoides TaxID=125765 RepID=UPI003A99AF9D